MQMRSGAIRAYVVVQNNRLERKEYIGLSPPLKNYQDVGCTKYKIVGSHSSGW
jgi:hypothetical protein